MLRRWEAFDPRGLRKGFLLLLPVSISCASNAAATLSKDGLPLPMSFEASSRVLVLFNWWNATTSTQYAFSCLCCIAFGFISIAWKVLRHLSEMRLMVEEARSKPKLLLGSIPVYHNAIRGSIACLNYAWDYMLMLVAMTFNVGIIFSLMSGISLGFFAIGHFLDYTPEVSSSCECSVEFSCGCHRGQPCTCYKTAKLILPEPQAKDNIPVVAQPEDLSQDVMALVRVCSVASSPSNRKASFCGSLSH
ncbi:hypothetical protein Efla_004505 [Eimeria flavescens]